MRQAVSTPAEVLHRYPRLVAHLICESLGYLTPKSAANWILAAKSYSPFWCEWSVHMAQGCDADRVIEVTRETVARAFKRRKYHRGSMADYRYARTIVDKSTKGFDPLFASWF